MFSNYIYKPTIFLCGSYIGALTYDFTYNIRNFKNLTLIKIQFYLEKVII